MQVCFLGLTETALLLGDKPNAAAMLLKHIMGNLPEGRYIKLKIPSENQDAVSLMKKIGFSTEPDKANPHLIMFTKYRFQVDTSKVYCLLNDMHQFA